MELLKIKNETGLELTVATELPEGIDYAALHGGMDIAPQWEQYLDDFIEPFQPNMQLVKKAIEQLGWVGDTAENHANDTVFIFSDGTAIGFTWRAWGDLMSAIVGKNEGYMAYYM